MKRLKLAILIVVFTNCIIAQQPQIGTITSVNGKKVSLKLETTPTDVKPASTGYVSKDLTGVKGPLGITFTSGWLDIGEVKIISIAKNTALLEIIEEKRDIVVNGKVQEKFVVGKKIKIEWIKQ
jgi:hypothetical protein